MHREKAKGDAVSSVALAFEYIGLIADAISQR
jgi:hypothetical protein